MTVKVLYKHPRAYTSQSLDVDSPPPVELENSVIIWPRGILAPQGVGVGLGSMSLIQAEKIRT